MTCLHSRPSVSDPAVSEDAARGVLARTDGDSLNQRSGQQLPLLSIAHGSLGMKAAATEAEFIHPWVHQHAHLNMNVHCQKMMAEIE